MIEDKYTFLTLQSGSIIEFAYTITHNSDYDEDCDVCVTHADLLNQLLGDWLHKATIVESDWMDENFLIPMDRSHFLILKSGPEPVLERLLYWLVDNFDDTIKLASVESIVFQDHATQACYACIIEY